MDPESARREASRRFGDLRRMRTTLHALGHERDLHMRRTQYLGELWQDITFTWRQLVKNPGFTAVAVLTLALGIGGTTAIFSAVYAVVLRPLPVREPSRLLLVGENYGGEPQVMSVGNYVDTNAAVTGFEGGLSALNYANFNLSDGATPERVVGARVTANYFDVIGVRPMLDAHSRSKRIGRARSRRRLEPSDLDAALRGERIGAGARRPHERRELHRRRRHAGVVRSDVRQRGTVDADRLHAGAARDARRALPHDQRAPEAWLHDRTGPNRARRRRGAPAPRFPQDNPTLSFGVVPVRGPLRRRLQAAAADLLAAVALVLLIACGNVANLLLARGASRAREIAVRAALGAGRWRIARQLLTESAILALVAAVAGVAIAYWGIGAVVAWSPPDVPRLEQARNRSAGRRLRRRRGAGEQRDLRRGAGVAGLAA
jgi:hypothetical protein